MNEQMDIYMRLITLRSLLDAEQILKRGITKDDEDILKLIVVLKNQLKRAELYSPEVIDQLIQEAINEC